MLLLMTKTIQIFSNWNKAKLNKNIRWKQTLDVMTTKKVQVLKLLKLKLK